MLMERAVQHLQAGNIAAARTILESNLRSHPDDADTLRLLGKILFHQGDVACGIELLTKAKAVTPDHAEIPYELGVMWLNLGKPEQAAPLFRETLRNQPGHQEALFNLAWALRRQGQMTEAKQALRRFVGVNPDHVDAWFNLGNAHLEDMEAAEAEEAYRNVLALQPDYFAAAINLASAVQMRGAVDEAVGLLKGVLSTDPGSTEAANALGNLLTKMGHLDGAVAVFRSALDAHPNDVVTLCNLAMAQAESQPRIACGLFLQALKYAPEMAVAWNGLGTARLACEDLPAAEQAFRQALALRPGYGDALSNLGKVLCLQGQNSEALDCMKVAVEAEPENARIGSNLLQLLRHMSDQSPADVFAEHVLFGQRQEAIAKVLLLSPPTRGEARRRLRIGYVSPDFCEHAAMLFFEPVLQYHTHAQVETFCYHTHNFVDAVTRRLMAHADHWRPISHLSFDAAAALIRQDRIDILVDLAGHTANSGLPIFARKPAPIQATWLGYPGTSGLSRMDYRLTDAGTDPEDGGNEAFYTEKLVRLQVASAFRPPLDAPKVEPAPFLRRGRLRFGAFNKMTKINAPVLNAWSRILAELPEAELIMVIPGGELGTVRNKVHNLFAERGVSKDRILIEGTKPLRQFLEVITDIDIALDTFPYCGGTTSLLTLWMGVPLICCKGCDSASATSGLLLSSIGLDDLVADDDDDYVRLARALADDSERLTELRASLRDRIRTLSPFDERRMLRDLEDTYRDWWLCLIAERTAGTATGMPGRTPPLDSSADPYWGHVLFSLSGAEADGDVPFSDSLGNMVRIKGGVSFSPSQPGGVRFDRHAYATVPTHESWNLGRDDFTVECLCWIPCLACLGDAGGLTLMAVCSRLDVADHSWNLLLNTDGSAYGWITNRGTIALPSDYILAGTTTNMIRFGEWNHVAMVRHANLLTVFLNGIGTSADCPSDFAVWPSSTPLSIGANGNGTCLRFMESGYLDGLRITKGVARYIKDFIPPLGGYSGANGTSS